MQLKPIEHYIENRNILKKYGEVWRDISGRPFVGNTTYLIEKFKPNTYQEFLDMYLKSGENKTDKKDHFNGRTEADLWEHAKSYQENAGNYTIPLEAYFDDVITHVIIETLTGKIPETTFKSMMEGLGYITEVAEGNDDAVCGIDLKVYKQNPDLSKELVYLFQIKPISFFYATRSDTIKDRIAIYAKEEKAYKKYGRGVKFYYVIYDFNELKTNGKLYWYSYNGKGKFTKEELCDSYGNPLIPKAKLEKVDKLF